MRIITVLAACVLCCGVSAFSQDQQKDQQEDLVFVGDTETEVYEMLGEPKIEFPKDGKMIRWYAGYELTFSSNVVVTVKRKKVMTEEEKAERAYRAQLANERLQAAYRASADKEQISYAVWLERERKQRADERAARARAEAYRERVSREKREAIRANGKGGSRHIYIHSGD